MVKKIFFAAVFFFCLFTYLRYRFLTHSGTFEPNSFHFDRNMPPGSTHVSNVDNYSNKILILSKLFYFRNCCTWISSWTPNGFNPSNPVDSENNSSSKVCSPHAFTKKQSRILNFQKLYCLIFFPGFELVM